MGIVTIHRTLWRPRRFGLEPADFLTPAIVRPLGQPALTNRIGNALTLRDQTINLAQFRSNLLRLVSRPRYV
jgi:hypothetical protein